MTMRYQNTCILFDAHRLDDFILNQYNAYRAASAGLCDIYLTLHSNSGPPDLETAVEDLLPITDEMIFDWVSSSKAEGRQVVPGNCDLKLLAAIAACPRDYDHYVLVEFDVVCTDELRPTLLRLLEVVQGQDLCGSYVSHPPYDDRWVWSDSLVAPPGVTFDPNDRRSAFLPLSAYSRRLVACYRQAISQGWLGHQEILLPTIAHLNGLKIHDLGPPHGFTDQPHFGPSYPMDIGYKTLPPFIHPIKTHAMLQQALLETTKKQPSPPPEVFGAIEAMPDGMFLLGWVKVAGTEIAPRLVVKRGGAILGTGMPDLHRPDIGGMNGFSLKLDEKVSAWDLTSGAVVCRVDTGHGPETILRPTEQVMVDGALHLLGNVGLEALARASSLTELTRLTTLAHAHAKARQDQPPAGDLPPHA